MNKGFLFTLATFILISTIFGLLMNFNEHQVEFIDSMSRDTAGYRITQTWSDVQESIPPITDMNIVKNGNSLEIIDKLPKIHDTAVLLKNYGIFIENVYEPENVNIEFFSIDGAPISLDAIPSYLRINPSGIIYDYPDKGHDELLVTLPSANFTNITSTAITIMITNKRITELQWKWAPYKNCAGADCIKLTITVTDGITTHVYAENSFDRKQQSATAVALTNPGSIDIRVGSQNGASQEIFEVVMHNAQADATTTLLLNNSAFSVIYPSKLSIADLNYNISKKDWFQ